MKILFSSQKKNYNQEIKRSSHSFIDMLRIGMLLSCIFMSNTALDEQKQQRQQEIHQNELMTAITSGGVGQDLDFDNYAVTCYICVNVSDNLICNQYAIDRPCKPGENFCHTLHIMDSKGTSVLVNKKCTSETECQRTKVGCVEIDTQTMCVSCCDHNYCNKLVPNNSSTAIFDDKITKMRMLAKNLFKEKEKAQTISIKDATSSGGKLILFHPMLNVMKIIIIIILRLLVRGIL